MQSETNWLSADWGTTNFRLRLVAGASLQILAEVTSEDGVASVFQQWTSGAGKDAPPEQRVDYYKRFLLERIRELETKISRSLKNMTVVLSGMAGSSIGMITLPYQQMPCAADGSGLQVLRQRPDESFPYFLVLVSGVSDADDVMRGEETMLVGAVCASNESVPAWYIFPGTHSKHIFVSDNRILKLRTYMTGELFALLSGKSILAGSVERSAPNENAETFAAGLEEGWSGRLAHSLFLVRTNDLLGKINRAANYQFLSGMLIGHELRDLPAQHPLCLVGDGELIMAYETAIRQLLPQTRIELSSGAAALIRGQWQIAARSGEFKN